MAKVTGIGGVFFRSPDAKATQQWYVEHLGLPEDGDGYVVIPWQQLDGIREATVWSAFDNETKYFDTPEGPGESSEFMVNYIVDDLDGMRDQLRGSGATVMDKTEVIPSIGRFGWAVDCDGRKFELWEPERTAAAEEG